MGAALSGALVPCGVAGGAAGLDPSGVRARTGPCTAVGARGAGAGDKDEAGKPRPGGADASTKADGEAAGTCGAAGSGVLGASAGSARGANCAPTSACGDCSR